MLRRFLGNKEITRVITTPWCINKQIHVHAYNATTYCLVKLAVKLSLVWQLDKVVVIGDRNDIRTSKFINKKATLC